MLGTLRVLEVAATGKDTRTHRTVQDLADHARKLIGDALRAMNKQVEAISKSANEQVEYQVPVVDPSNPRARRWRIPIPVRAHSAEQRAVVPAEWASTAQPGRAAGCDRLPGRLPWAMPC